MSKGVDAVADVTEIGARPENFRPDPTRILSGDPAQMVWNRYAEETGQFLAGLWQGEPGKWRVNYTEHEFCHLLAGRVVLTDEQGQSRSFGPGASFVIPSGFAGTWETVERARKIYVIFELKT